MTYGENLHDGFVCFGGPNDGERRPRSDTGVIHVYAPVPMGSSVTDDRRARSGVGRYILQSERGGFAFYRWEAAT